MRHAWRSRGVGMPGDHTFVWSKNSRQSNVSALPVSYVAADIRAPWSLGLGVSTWGVGHVWSDCVPWARGLLLGHRSSRPLCVFVL